MNTDKWHICEGELSIGILYFSTILFKLSHRCLVFMRSIQSYPTSLYMIYIYICVCINVFALIFEIWPFSTTYNRRVTYVAGVAVHVPRSVKVHFRKSIMREDDL